MRYDWITPHWPVPPNVRALVTTRQGGVSRPPYDSMNLGLHVGDDEGAVLKNRTRLRTLLPASPLWLEQVHGTAVIDDADFHDPAVPPCGDAVVTGVAGTVCAVMTADCLPVLLCGNHGRVVAAAHAGWRGLCDGILEETVARMRCPADSVLAWLGPAIGPTAYEVGAEVRAAFMARDERAVCAFAAARQPGKWFADLFLLARMRLASAGVERVYGGGVCTYSDAARFYSYRRDGVTGRFASLIWLDAASLSA